MKEIDIISPFTGIIQRIAYPYDKSEYQGILLESGWITLKMFYFKPDPKLIGKKVKQGQKIGIAQDISKLYNTPTKTMTPHIHLQVERVYSSYDSFSSKNNKNINNIQKFRYFFNIKNPYRW